MTNDEKAPEASEETTVEATDETTATSSAEPTPEVSEAKALAPESPSPLRSEEKSLEAKIDLLVNVAMLTIMTLMRLVKEKGPEAIGEAELAQLDKVRESVQMAADAVEEWSQEGDSDGNPLDLSKMQAKLDMLKRKIDEWPLGQADLDSTPPS